MTKTVFAVGIGPGKEDGMTKEAFEVLKKADVIVGYPLYLELLPKELSEKEMLSTPMRAEKERCEIACSRADEGKSVAVVCSGDAGVYGMASLLYFTAERYPGVEVIVIPGVTAALSGAALLGAPLANDFCLISLSDLLTPWEVIEKRLTAAAQGDFAIALYNPASHKRPEHLKRACEILLRTIPKDRLCGYCENIGREGERAVLLSLEELSSAKLNMFTTVFIGCADTVRIGQKMVTKRGYKGE